MNSIYVLWLKVTGRYAAKRSESMQRHPAGKRVGK